MINNFFKLHIPMYNDELYVSVNQSDEDFIKSIPKKHAKGFESYLQNEVDPTWGAYCLYHDGLKVGIIRIPEVHDLIRLIQFMSHEIFHYVSYVLRDRGVKPCYDSEESYAYMIDYITKQIFVKLIPTHYV